MTENLNTELKQQLRVSCSEVAAAREEPSVYLRSREPRANACAVKGGYSGQWESWGA